MALLSICIPTYNRCGYLKKTLDTIVAEPSFLETDDVNIFIQDNCSNDDTECIAKEYQDKCRGKIFYNRNKENIGFANFNKVLSVADGQFLKLHNDTLLMRQGSLAKLIRTVKENLESKNIPFFLNASLECTEGVCSSFDEFIQRASYFNTWIGCFGLWREDYERLKDVLEIKRYTEIPQTYILFKLLEEKRNIYINNDLLFEVNSPTKKGGYNIAEVFGQNYLDMLQEFMAKGFLTRNVYEYEKEKLIKFINFYYFDKDNLFSFHKTGYFRFLLKYYWHDKYFYKELFNMLSFDVIYKKEKKDDLREIKIFGGLVHICYKKRKKKKDV